MTETKQLDAHDAWCRAEAAKLRPAVRTVADALREMPVGTKWRKRGWSEDNYAVKIGDNKYEWRDGFIGSDCAIAHLSLFADDPDNGIIILSTPDAVPPTVDVACKGCGNVMRGLTPNNIAYCMDCGTDNPNPLNLEQPVYAQVMGRGALSQPKQPAGVVVTLPIDLAKRLRDAAWETVWLSDAKIKAMADDVSELERVIGIATTDARRKAGG